HDTVYLSHDQPGRALLLDSWFAADRAGCDFVEQVLVRVARIVGAVFGAGAAERYYVARADPGDRRASIDMRAAVPGAGFDCRRVRRDDAEFSGDVAVEDRGRF